MNTPLPPLPGSWSALTWQQLCEAWTVKMRYGGNPDVAGAAALLTLYDIRTCVKLTYEGSPIKGDTPQEASAKLKRHSKTEHICDALPSLFATGEDVYALTGSDGHIWAVTPRELAWMARQAVAWLQYPYGDPGEPAVKDEKGKVVREAREPVRGYVSNKRDALVMPCETLTIGRGTLNIEGLRRPWWKRIISGQWPMFNRTFALPQVACNNLTWQQYRSLQAIAPQLFAEGIGEQEALGLQAQFLAHILTPRSLALLDTAGGSIRLRPHYEYRYNAEQAEGLARWWEKRLTRESRRDRIIATAAYHSGTSAPLSVLFHICFQAYQTALSYYAASYPLLFSDSGKTDPLRDALTGEVGTINTIMKYAGYAEQQQVYDSNLPFVLDILNTMTKEAKEIEKMNSKIKRK